jgi:succinate dehydrogenase/fumarate reductase flavoprotein subunit
MDLREKVFATMMAGNAHTLVRALETIDLMECGEIIFHTALERKETRGLHKRFDFPFTNPLLQDKWITIRKENGKPKIGWRDKN